VSREVDLACTNGKPTVVLLSEFLYEEFDGELGPAVLKHLKQKKTENRIMITQFIRMARMNDPVQRSTDMMMGRRICPRTELRTYRSPLRKFTSPFKQNTLCPAFGSRSPLRTHAKVPRVGEKTDVNI